MSGIWQVISQLCYFICNYSGTQNHYQGTSLRRNYLEPGAYCNQTGNLTIACAKGRRGKINGSLEPPRLFFLLENIESQPGDQSAYLSVYNFVAITARWSLYCGSLTVSSTEAPFCSFSTSFPNISRVLAIVLMLLALIMKIRQPSSFKKQLTFFKAISAWLRCDISW